MHRILFLLILFVVLSSSLFAQRKLINGTVTDVNGIGLVGVNVIIKGTYEGCVTNPDGKFELTATKNDVLEFSMVGFTKQQITVSEKNTYLVRLEEGVKLSEVAVVGSRNALRMNTQTPVPVDIIDIQSIAASAPQITLGELLNYNAPSFSSNAQTISDGTDHVDPATLRGLGPDQLLVLINGKRRHTSSLININGTVGRGSVGTDMNAIPVSAISRIEVLRDGASAQYGSDAIAGVINIILKDSDGFNISAISGANMTSKSEKVDGFKNELSVNYGLPVGDKGGKLFLSAEINFRIPVDRNGAFEGQIFNRLNTIERLARGDGYSIAELTENDIANYATSLGFNEANQVLDENLNALQSFLNDDVSNEELAARNLNRNDFNISIGQSKLSEGKLFLNFHLPLNKKVEMYTFGGLSYRSGLSAGFYRLPFQSRNYSALFINGFLPEIKSEIGDQSLTAGIKGVLGKCNFDFSNTFGRNSFDYTISNTLNASMEERSPTSMDAGGHSFMQNTTNLDFSRHWKNILSGFNFAWGLEHRLENYRIVAGEEASWALYDKNGNVVEGIADQALTVTDFFGESRPGGAQVFPGFRPENETNRYRNSIAVYSDVEVDLTSRWMWDMALRFENYSDFGSTLNYKLSTAFSVTDHLRLRGAISTGFRAPSLHQLYFNRVNTQFIAGLPIEIGTYSNNSELARLLGIPELNQERSRNYSMGATCNIPALNLSITTDVFLTNILDRISYTGLFSATDDPADKEIADILTSAGASSASFFANSIDVRAKGLDLVISQRSKIGSGKLNSSFSATFSETRHVGEIHASELLADKLDTYFNEYDRVLLEEASPRTKLHLSFNYQMNNFSFVLNESFFGAVTHASAIVKDQQILSSKVLTDVSVGYKFPKNLGITLGANNLFDVYPDKLLTTNADYSLGRFPYSRRSTQFGFAGRFLFARLTYSFN